MPTGIGEPVFDKLDAMLAHAIMSIGAVKAVEIGDGTKVSRALGSEDNDGFESVVLEDLDLTEDEDEEAADGDDADSGEDNDESGMAEIQMTSNHAGGILGGMSDGAEIVLRAYFKPTPSIAKPQQTANEDGENITIEIKGRHDPTVVERACVVVECMTAITILDALMDNMTAQMDYLRTIYQ